jgi:uncharacterized Ntn-hydrolase superfamily protein
MTWSIVARDPETGTLAAAVSTRFFAVGAVCPFIEAGVGALSTQALLNPYYAIDGMRLLRDKVAPAEIIARLTGADPGAHCRQFHIVDIAGRIAQHTGKQCVDWAGHVAGADFSVAGNMLAGPQVVQKTAERFAATKGQPMAERLLQALEAGEAAGGDKRGKQSAALKVYTGEPYPELDIRVDDHAEPLVELRRLYVKSKERWGIFRRFLPTRLNPAGTIDRAVIDAAIAKEGNPAP